MDHKALIASLPAEQRKAMLQRSDAKGLAHLAVHWGLIGLVGWLIMAGVPGWQALMVFQGLLVIFCFTLLHETVHKTPFATEWLNEAVMLICGFLVVLPPEHFRYFHLAHHRYTNDPDKDPELAGEGATTWAGYFWRVTGVPIWREHIGLVLKNAAGRCDDDFAPEGRKPRIRVEAQVMLALYLGVAALIFAGQSWLFWCWIGPAILGQPFLRLYLMAEHGRCPAVANMLENSRTTFTNRLVRRLAWNMPYHAEHHAWPMVPFHQLPAFHEVTKPHLKKTSDGYVEFHREFTGDLT